MSLMYKLVALTKEYLVEKPMEKRDEVLVFLKKVDPELYRVLSKTPFIVVRERERLIIVREDAILG